MLLLSGCASLTHRDAIEDLRQFAALAGNPQVRYEPGGQAFARRVADWLPAAMRQVEAGHHRAFRAPPVVYVCPTEACFERFVPRSFNFSAAVVYDNRLVLGPRLFRSEPQRLLPVLKHELSHLLLGQHRGHYTTSIPVWFHEGLASLVAAGGGADLVTDEDAWRAIQSGRHFVPDEQHRGSRRGMADRWRLPVSVFYRQAMLYLAELRERDPVAFRQLLDRLHDGEAFDLAFVQSFHVNPAHAAKTFFWQLDCSPPRVATQHSCATDERISRRAD